MGKEDFKYWLHCWYHGVEPWDSEFIALWLYQLSDASLRCWSRQEALTASMVHTNGIAKVLWCDAPSIVQMMRKVWFRTEEPSEVTLVGSPLCRETGSDCSSVYSGGSEPQGSGSVGLLSPRLRTNHHTEQRSVHGN